MAELLSQAASPILPRCVAWAYIVNKQPAPGFPPAPHTPVLPAWCWESTGLPSYTLQNVPVHISGMSRLR